MIRFTLFILLFIWAFTSRSQVDTNYVKHLIYNDLNFEHRAYLNVLETDYPDSDSIVLYQAKFLISQDSLSTFIQSRYINNPSVQTDTVLLNNAFVRCLGDDSLYAQFQKQLANKQKTYTIEALMLLRDSLVWNDIFQDYPKEFYNDLLVFEKKKPWKAALYSAAIPNSGKLYNGRQKNFWPGFIFTTGVGLATYEAIERNGLNNWYSWACLSASSVLYLSNIVGTAFDLKTVKKEKRVSLYNAITYIIHTDNPIY